MRTLDKMPEEVNEFSNWTEGLRSDFAYVDVTLNYYWKYICFFQRTILMKLLYYDDVTVCLFLLINQRLISFS